MVQLNSNSNSRIEFGPILHIHFKVNVDSYSDQ